MVRRALPVILLMIAVMAGGCGLLGFGDSGNSGSKADVEMTINAMVEAGKAKDSETLAAYIASSIMMEILDDSEEMSPLSMVGNQQLVSLLDMIWEDMEMQRVEASIGEINIHGGQAEVAGTFAIEFINPQQEVVEVTGYAVVTLANDNGTWQVTSAVVNDVAILINGELPDNEEPVDDDEDETGDPAPGDEDMDDEDDDVDPQNGVPNYRFQTCEYLMIGAGGDQVKAMQDSLKFLGYDVGLIDGDFGPRTDAAVRAFQADHGLYVDGEFGPISQDALNKALKAYGGAFTCVTSNQRPKNTGAGPTTLSMSALRKGTAFETPVYIYQSPNSGPTLAFVGCIHGNERSGHLAMVDAIDKGITISRGRLIMIPALNKIACQQNRRTLSRSGSLLAGKDFNRMFPVGRTPTYTIAKELWNLLRSQPNLRFVVDFHDGFVNSLANTLLHTRQSEASTVARKVRDSLNRIRPSGSRGPRWRAFTEPISGSLIRKVGRDMGVPGILAELAGRNPGDNLSLRKQYAWTIIKTIGDHYGMKIDF